jgi:lipopolysaccharide export system permease protein
MISIAINFFENVDKLLDKSVKLKEVFTIYYLNFIPWINGLLWPLFALLAVIYFTSRLATDTEFVAMLSAGISYNRLVKPFIITGCMLAVFLWIGNNYVIPNSTRIKNQFEAEYIKKSAKQTSNSDLHFFISPNEKVYFRNFSIRDSAARIFRLERFLDNRLVYMLKSPEVIYKSSKNKWEYREYEEHRFDSVKQTMTIKKGILRDTLLPFHPDDFVRYTKQMEMMTTDDLKDFINAEEQKGLGTTKKYLIELYRRTADPFTILILSLIGVSIASRKVRGGLGLHLASGVVIGAAYVILSKFTVTIATNMAFPPLLGIWIPNIMFSIIAFIIFRFAQK